MLYLCRFILGFSIYSFLGWVCECIYCSFPARRFINRGFLAGPVCPVYGFGAMLVLAALSPLTMRVSSAGLVFVFGLLLTTALEYATSFLLEKLFRMKWWDYSHYKLNIHGRVCLLNSVLFGLLCVFVVFVVNPPIARLVEELSLLPLVLLAGISVVLFVCDTVISVRATLELSGKLGQLYAAMEELHEKTEAYRIQFKKDIEEKLEELLESDTEESRAAVAIARLKARIAEISGGGGLLHRRLLAAFPSLRSARRRANARR